MSVTPQAVRFGIFELDLNTGDLLKNGYRLKLQQQPIRLVTLLIEHSGQAVTREQVKEALWPANTFVDFDNAINSAVAKLRQALGDSAENPRFVETLARRGYLFIAPVHLIELSNHNASQVAKNGSAVVRHVSAAATAIGSAQRRTFIATALAVTALTTVPVAWLLRRTVDKTHDDVRVTPLTAVSGIEGQPSFSPDGTRV